MDHYKATLEANMGTRTSNKQMKQVDYSDISLEMIRQNRQQSNQVATSSKYQTRNTSFQKTSEIIADARMGSIDTNFKQQIDRFKAR